MLESIITFLNTYGPMENHFETSEVSSSGTLMASELGKNCFIMPDPKMSSWGWYKKVLVNNSFQFKAKKKKKTL